MKRSMNVKNRGYRNFMMEFFFIQNAHPQGLHVSYFISRFLPLKSAQFINLFLELVNFTLFSMWTCHNSLMVPINFIFGKVPNWLPWSF